jgi:hypothetical protein
MGGEWRPNPPLRGNAVGASFQTTERHLAALTAKGLPRVAWRALRRPISSKKTTWLRATLSRFGSSTGRVLCSNGNEVFDCWDEKRNAVRVIADLDPQLPPQL